MAWDPLLCGLMPGGDYTDEDGEAIAALPVWAYCAGMASSWCDHAAEAPAEALLIADEAVHLEVAL